MLKPACTRTRLTVRLSSTFSVKYSGDSYSRLSTAVKVSTFWLCPAAKLRLPLTVKSADVLP